MKTKNFASWHEFDENKQLDHSLTDFFHSYFIKATDFSLYGFPGAIKIDHLGCWENSKACKILFTQPHAARLIAPVNLQKEWSIAYN